MRIDRTSVVSLGISVVAALCLSATALAAPTKSSLPTITPAQLSAQLKAKHPPKMFQVGEAIFFVQAHIPGSKFAGPAQNPEGIDALKEAVKSLPKDTPIVIYCGCCPWAKCPNVLPAYQTLQELHFSHVKVLKLRENFSTDWMNKGYPVEKGMPTGD